MIPVYFPLGGCVDNVINSQTIISLLQSYFNYILYCTQNCKFYFFLETKICFVKKIVQYILRLMYLFCPKISKNDSRKSFIKKLLDTILHALSFSVHNIFSHFYDLILA